MGLKTEGLDVVYVVKDTPENEELRYSLRSLKNLKGIRKVWIFGGCPNCVNKDIVNHIPMKQTGNTKWAKSNSSVKEACQLEAISENFILFNDDFFVMKKIEELDYYYHGTLDSRVKEIIGRNVGWRTSGYARRLIKESISLQFMGKPALNYAVHIPMIFNKKQTLDLFEKFPRKIISRAIYGNYYEVGGIDTEDVKIYQLDEKPSEDSVFLSSTNVSFAQGEVGKYIRRKLKGKSVYEQDRSI